MFCSGFTPIAVVARVASAGGASPFDLFAPSIPLPFAPGPPFPVTFEFRRFPPLGSRLGSRGRRRCSDVRDSFLRCADDCEIALRAGSQRGDLAHALIFRPTSPLAFWSPAIGIKITEDAAGKEAG